MVPAEGISEEHRGLLLELSLLISERRGVDDVFASFADHVRLGIAFDFTSLFVLTADPKYVRSVGHYGAVHPETAAGTIHRAQALGLDRMANVPDGDEYIPKFVDLEATQEMARNGFQRAWATPLMVDDTNYGLLTVAKLAPGRFAADHVAFLRASAALLARAVRQDLELERARRNAARAQAASELIFALQAQEPFETIFQRLPGLLENGLEMDYVGLVINNGEGFVMGVEVPASVHRGDPPTPEGTALIRELAAQHDFVQFRPEGGWTESLFGAGFRRGALAFLHDEDDLRGILMLARKTDRKFDGDERHFIALLQSILSQSLANQHRLARTETQAARARTLNEVALLINAGEDIAAIFQRLLGVLEDAIEIDYVGLLKANEDRETFVMVGSRPEIVRPSGAIVTGEELAIDGIVGLGKTLAQYRIGNFAGKTRFADVMERHGNRRSATVLIQQDGELQGVLSLARKSEARFTPDEEAFLETLTAMLGQAIANQRRFAAARSEAIRAQVLSELAVLLQGGEPIENHFAALSDIMLQAFGFDFLSITTRDPRTSEFRAIRSHSLGDDDGSMVFQASAFELVQREGRPTLQYPTSENPNPVPAAMSQMGFPRACSSLIRSPEGPQGIFTIGRREDTPFSPDELSFIELVSALLGQATANYLKAHARDAEALRSRILSELALLLNNGEPIDAHFQRLREILLEGVGFDYCSVSVRIGTSSTFRALRSEPLPGDTSEAPAVGEAGINGILSTGRFSGQYGPEAADRGAPPALFALGIDRGASFVLTTGGEPEGLLTIGRKAEEPFAESEMAFFEVVASLLAYAAASERRLQMTTEEAEDQAILAHAASAVARENDGLAIVRSLRAAVASFVPRPFVSFGYLADGGIAFLGADRSLIPLPMGENFRIALDAGQRIVLPEYAGTPEASAEIDRLALRAHVITRVQAAGAPLGVLVLGSRDADFRPSDRELRLCQLIGDIVGPAMANARTAEREREEAEDQAILAGAAAAVARETDARLIVAGLRDAIGRFMPEPFIRFAFLENEALSFLSPSGERVSQPMGPYFRAAVETGQSVVPSTDLREAAGEPVFRSRAARLQSHVLTRAESAGTVVGFLLAGSRDAAYRPGERDLKLCRQIADICGPAMANARAAARERQEAEDQAIVAEAAAAAAREREPLGIVRALRNAINRFIPQPFVNFGFLDGEDSLFPTREGSWRRIAYGPRFREALRDGQSVVPNSANRTDELVGEPNRLGIEAHIVTRAASGGSTVGLLIVGSRDAEFAPRERELHLCRLIADILGPAMANSRALERERQEAEDQAIIAEAAASVARETSPLAIVRGLRSAVGRFIPSPFVNFGYLEGNAVRFPSRTGDFELMHIDQHFTIALQAGQHTVASTASRVAQGEALDDVVSLGLQAHVLTRASSAGNTTGLLVLGSRQEDFAPGERELRLCRLIADIVGPAMANARAVERERIEAEEQRVIAEVAAVAAREAEPGAMVAHLQRPLRGLVPRPFLAFGYMEGEEVVFPRPDGSMARLPLDDQARRTDAEDQVAWDEPPADLATNGEAVNLGVHAICSTAVRSGGATVGFLLIGSRDPAHRFSERELRNFRLIAQIVGPAMENARATLRARLDAEEQRFLAVAAAAVAGAKDESALAATLSETFSALVPDVLVSLSFRENQSDYLSGPDGRFRIGPQAERAFESGQSEGNIDDSDITSRSRALMEREGLKRWVYTATTSEGDASGLLWVATRHPAYEFTDRDRRFCRLVADFVGPALANLREVDRRRAEAEEQRILAEAAAAVARAADVASLVSGLHAPIRLFVPQSRVTLFHREQTHMLAVEGGQQFPIGPQMQRALDGEQVTGSIDDPEMIPESREAMAAQGIARFVDTPIVAGGETLGVFLVATRDHTFEFTERDLRVLRLIAGFAGPAIANLRESARRKQEAEEQRILADTAAALASGATELELLEGLSRTIRGFVPRARVAFSYIEGDEMMLWDGRNRRPIHELTRIAIQTGQVSGDVETSPMTDASRELIRSAKIRRFVDSAATAGGATVGLLFIGTPLEDHEFSERDRRMLRLIADIAGPAMVNAREERRRRDEAEDQRILSEIAAVAARASSSAEIIDSLGEALAPRIPLPFTLFGMIDGNSVTYLLTRDNDRALIGANELSLPMSAVGLIARETGQATGSMELAPPGAPYAALGLKDYALTCHYSAGAPAGVLFVGSRDAAYHFSERDLALLKRVLQVVGPAIESARAEAELARQSELYGLMLRSLSEGIVLSDLDGKVVFVNALGRKILRALDPNGAATNWMEIVELLPEDTRPGYRAVYEEGAGSRGRTSLTVDGRTAWFDYELVPLNDPVMKILLVAADVTADVEREAEQTRHRQQLEQASRLAALGELIGGVAHELNNPLTAILGFAEVMALSPAAGPFSEELSIVQTEALRARNIVRDLLFIVRPGTTERMVFPVSDLVAHIERLRRAAWVQQGIRWEINIEQPCTVWGNEHQLTQVLLNLVTNAEHALAESPDRQITIRAFMTGPRTELSISDSGAGMDEATRLRVFEPFFTTKHGLGTGLGLPLSYSIIQSHEGEIAVASEPGQGTTFTLNLPAVPESPDSPPASPAGSGSGSVSVLVIDDEPSLRKVCQRLVTSMGHECVTAENSAAAIELALQRDFDLVLCDYRLASETADDVVAGLERVAPHLIPRIVIATGATTDAGVVELTQRYNLPLMAKPYGIEDLISVIGRARAPAR